MRAYSLDLRERTVAARAVGESVESVAERFGVCTKTVRVYEKRAAQGQLAPTPQTGKACRLSAEQHQELRALAQERSDWTLASLAQAWQERTQQMLPSSTLHDALQRVGVTYKKESHCQRTMPRKTRGLCPSCSRGCTREVGVFR